MDITQYQFQNFNLSPGVGGVGEYNRAGGGGGVVVNTKTGHGVRDQEGPTDGVGYGAGSGNGWAEKGLVLIEIVS